jgi:glucosylceramidase
MKDGGKMEGGWLKEEYYDAYARYLLKFIQEYEGLGIALHAITVQNEPLALNSHYPTTLMLPQVQADLIADHIAPLLRNASASVRIWAFDHNFDGGLIDYPQQLLRSHARRYIDGVAYHNYAGPAPNPNNSTEILRRILFSCHRSHSTPLSCRPRIVYDALARRVPLLQHLRH